MHSENLCPSGPIVNKKRMNSLIVQFETSAVNEINSPEYILQFDKLHMRNGDVYLVNQISSGEVELSLITRKKLNKAEFSEMLKTELSYVKRAECFERG